MQLLPVNEVIKIIIKKTGLSEEFIRRKIKEKIDFMEGLISEEGAAYIVAHELGVKLLEKEKTRLRIKNIVSGLKNLEIYGKVIQIYPIKIYEKNDHKGRILSFIIGDETGKIRVVVWDEKIIDKLKNLKEGDIIHIKKGYVRENRGRLEIHLSSNSWVELNPPDIKIEIPNQYIRQHISEILEGNVELKGIITYTFENIPLFEICPFCNSRLSYIDGKWVCEEHGTVEPKYSFLITIVLDDGTGNIRVILFPSQTSHLLNLDKEEIINYIKTNPKSIIDLLIGKEVIIQGEVRNNEYFETKEVIARRVFEVDPVREGYKIIKELTL